MKTEVIIGIALLPVGMILLGTSLPVLLASVGHRCPPMPYMTDCSNEQELSLSIFGTAFTIAGMGLLAAHRFENPKV